MFYIETDKVTYNQIKTLLPDIKPDIKITLVVLRVLYTSIWILMN